MSSEIGIVSLISSNYGTQINDVKVISTGSYMERDVFYHTITLVTSYGRRTATKVSATTMKDIGFFTEFSSVSVSDLNIDYVAIYAPYTHEVLEVTNAVKSGNDLILTISGSLSYDTFDYTMIGNTSVATHIGGKADIWIAGSLTEEQYSITTSEAINILSGISLPFYLEDVYVTGASVSVALTNGSDYEFDVLDPDARFTMNEDGKLAIRILNSSYIGVPITVKYKYMGVLDTIDNYITTGNLFAGVDALVRGKRRGKVEVNATYTPRYSNQDIDTTSIKSVITDFFENKTGTVQPVDLRNSLYNDYDIIIDEDNFSYTIKIENQDGTWGAVSKSGIDFTSSSIYTVPDNVMLLVSSVVLTRS
mgnify:CR=1 FL=1